MNAKNSATNYKVGPFQVSSSNPSYIDFAAKNNTSMCCGD
jgi:hypothetical protein